MLRLVSSRNPGKSLVRSGYAGIETPACGPYDRTLGIGSEIAIDGADIHRRAVPASRKSKVVNRSCAVSLGSGFVDAPIDIDDLFATIKPELSAQLQ
jgi:hypothetical protein